MREKFTVFFLTATIVQDLSKPSILQLFKKDPLQICSVQNYLLLTNVKCKCKCHGNILHEVVDSFNPEIDNDFRFFYDISIIPNDLRFYLH